MRTANVTFWPGRLPFSISMLSIGLHIAGRMTFSLSEQKRRAGYAGLLALVIGHSLLLGRIDTNFRKNGVAEKCYVMTRTTLKILNRVWDRSETGRECRPLTPQIAKKSRNTKTRRPKQVTSNDPTFFLTTGQQVVWYSKDDSDQIEFVRPHGLSS